MNEEVIKQGAEARIYLGYYNGEHCLIKERFVKKYRHPELDEQITKQRMKAETKTAARCLAAGILAPTILHMNLKERRIYMEYFPSAIPAKQYIFRIVTEFKEDASEIRLEQLGKAIGDTIGRMHANDVIHGDLTTSNILLNMKPQTNHEYQVVLVDFGLAHFKKGVEDKGVDLYVLERALLSTHSQQPRLFEYIMAGYRLSCGPELNSVETKFEEVRTRGRKRTMIG